MSEWVYHLSVPWMATVVFLATAIITWLIHATVTRLAVDQRPVRSRQ